MGLARCRRACYIDREKYYKTGPRLSSAVRARIFDADRAVVPINNFRHNRQPQSHPAFLCRDKRIKYLLLQFRRNSRPGIADADFNTLRAASVSRIAHRPGYLDKQLTTALSAHSVVSVLNDVHECLLAQPLIKWHEGEIRLIFFVNSHRSALPELRHIVQRAFEYGGNVGGSQVGVQRS